MKTSFLFFIGVICWPLLEYILHRFSGHKYRFPKVFHVEHQTHHIKKDYFAPKWKKIMAANVFLAALTGLNLIWLNLMDAIIFSSGFIWMYLFYEFTHYSFHLYAPKTKLGLILRKHHFSHHFVNPQFNHGVTNTLADHLFGSFKPINLVPVPRKFAMNWLLDSEGKVKLEYREHFEIRGD